MSRISSSQKGLKNGILSSYSGKIDGVTIQSNGIIKTNSIFVKRRTKKKRQND